MAAAEAWQATRTSLPPEGSSHCHSWGSGRVASMLVTAARPSALMKHLFSVSHQASHCHRWGCVHVCWPAVGHRRIR